MVIGSLEDEAPFDSGSMWHGGVPWTATEYIHIIYDSTDFLSSDFSRNRPWELLKLPDPDDRRLRRIGT
jgi:hypothetical protein